MTVSMTSINPRKLTDWHLRFAEIAHGLINEHTDTFKDTEKDSTSDSTTERRLRTACVLLACGATVASNRLLTSDSQTATSEETRNNCIPAVFLLPNALDCTIKR